MTTTTELAPLGQGAAAAFAEAEARALWKFSFMKKLGLIEDRATLRRSIAKEGFPEPIILSANSVAWWAEEVRAWFASRPRGAAPQPRHPVRNRHIQAAASNAEVA